jgi:hypothetical protein
VPSSLTQMSRLGAKRLRCVRRRTPASERPKRARHQYSCASQPPKNGNGASSSSSRSSSAASAAAAAAAARSRAFSCAPSAHPRKRSSASALRARPGSVSRQRERRCENAQRARGPQPRVLRQCRATRKSPEASVKSAAVAPHTHRACAALLGSVSAAALLQHSAALGPFSRSHATAVEGSSPFDVGS